MAKKPKATKVTAADIAAVNAARRQVGEVTTKNAVAKAKELGNVPTEGGIQRMLMTLYHGAGAASDGKGFDIKAAHAAWVGVYYATDVAFPRKKPKDKQLKDICNSLQKFADLGALPYDSWPIASRAMAERNMNIHARAAKVEKLRAAHPDKAPTAEAIDEVFSPTAPSNRKVKKNIKGALKGVCSAIEKKMKDAAFIAGLAELAPLAVRFRAMAEISMAMRLLLTEVEKHDKVNRENAAFLKKIDALPNRKGSDKLH